MTSHLGSGPAARLLSAALLAGCSPDLPSDLGEHPLDRVTLAEVPALAHLAAAMDEPGERTVEDRLRQRPAYARPPDPSPWLAEVDGEPIDDWWRNAQAHALMLHYGGLGDAHVARGAARDIELLDRLPEYGAPYREEPFGDRARCEAMLSTFTASDCNSLYFEQYAATEYPSRIDHVLFRDAQQRVRVQSSAIEHTEPLPGAPFELSDHYGVGVTLQLPGE